MIFIYMFAGFGMFVAFMLVRILLLAKQWSDANPGLTPTDEDKDELIGKLLFRKPKE